MSEPTEAAYEAARATYDGVVIAHGAYGHRAGHHDAILAAVDAVWPLAADAGYAAGIAVGRRLAAEAIRDRAKEFHPFSARGELLAAAARIAEGTDDQLQ